jgi:uncharacterized membrane protein
MDVQVDYEAEVQLAVFMSARAAETGDRALSAAQIEHTLEPLGPGHYQLADRSLAVYARAVVGAAIVGAIIGALIGVGLALFFFGAATQIAIWFAVAGVVGGAIVGSLIGLGVAARYDNDVGVSIVVPAEPQAFVITTHTTQASPHHRRVRQILAGAGAVAFLDVARYEHERQGADTGVIVESTSVGGV